MVQGLLNTASKVRGWHLGQSRQPSGETGVHSVRSGKQQARGCLRSVMRNTYVALAGCAAEVGRLAACSACAPFEQIVGGRFV